LEIQLQCSLPWSEIPAKGKRCSPWNKYPDTGENTRPNLRMADRCAVSFGVTKIHMQAIQIAETVVKLKTTEKRLSRQCSTMSIVLIKLKFWYVLLSSDLIASCQSRKSRDALVIDKLSTLKRHKQRNLDTMRPHVDEELKPPSTWARIQQRPIQSQ
jgi:hypothetical protein